MRKSVAVLSLQPLLILGMLVPQSSAQTRPTWVQAASNTGGTAPIIGLTHSMEATVAVGAGAVVDFGDSLSIASEAGWSSFVARLDETGRPFWLQPGDFWSDRFLSSVAYDVTLDKEGNILATEGIPEVLDAGLFTAGGVALNKYDSSGAKLWEFSLPKGTESENPEAFIKGLGVDDSDNAYIVGEFVDTLVIGDSVMIADEADVFLASVSPDGDPRWVQQVHGPGFQHCSINQSAIASFDRLGNTYIACDWTEGTVFGRGQPNEFLLDQDASGVAKYDRDGLLQWVRTDGGGSLEVMGNVDITRVAADSSGNLFISWFYRRIEGETKVVVGDSTLRSNGLAGVFVTKYDPAGTLQWVRQIVSSAGAPYGGEDVWSLDTDQFGNVYVGGSFLGTLLLDDGQRFEAGGGGVESDGYVVAYDPDGDLVWTFHVSGPGNQNVTLMDVDPLGNLLVGGEFEDTLQVEGYTLAPKGFRDSFLIYFKAGRVLETSEDVVPGAPVRLMANFPNPFSRETTIRYHVASQQPIRIDVFDLLGRRVTTIVNETVAPGNHVVKWDAGDVPAGVYLYRLSSGVWNETRLMVVSR